MAHDQADERLTAFTEFGSNPGDLLAHSYVPAGLDAGAPLVVVLHGCTQTAGGYNRGAGWTSAADENGFALLFPEQQRANNPNLCFNWFSTPDTGRGGGEVLSIVQMIEALCARYQLDPARVFVTGLSAGGAMTAALLAAYPEVFAGGAVIAGLPFGTASTVPEAFERMRTKSAFGSEQLAALVRSASDHSGPWPILSVWHGGADRTVDSGNATALVDQWRGLQGLAAAPTASQQVAGHLRRVWSNAEGQEVIEEYVIADMGHGTPVHPVAANQGETAGRYMLDAGISSTRRIVAFWKLDGGERRIKAASAPVADARPASARPHGRKLPSPASPLRAKPASKVQDVIEKALRNAGLMR
ncbi:extracellular catalytic domain type 1 short-chain-length polyhydroxyalkanoate depolymerase [Sphingomonas glaciei]|uniref:PHB depolymerase family esterase n=1 Tax=Sphingomonas glaciei TaxID=2938948 RepID=A0ABY5MWT5_9SPHN|nr:PHB depolymerase family esterase [Sphingomonas glaciei]UUR08444.1 PHB depolymerase family esterase [Sphingomonas glaciei]